MGAYLSQMFSPEMCSSLNKHTGHLYANLWYLWLVVPKSKRGPVGQCKGWLYGFDGNDDQYVLPFFPDCQWRVIGFVQHLGDNRRAGHFVTWLKMDRGWLLANCLNPNGTVLYQNHGIQNLKDVLFIFLEKVERQSGNAGKKFCI